MRRPGYPWRALALGALLVGLAAVRPAGVRAATATVGSCTETSLTTAISAAGSGGTVQFAVDCSPLTVTSTITLSQDVTIDGNGHSVTISGGGSVQVFVVNSGVTVTLNDLTIANGSALLGGGIENLGTLSVTNSTFSGNSATDFGGGILNGSTLTVTNSTFSGNSATGNGGGIANGGTLTVTNSTFSGNSATFGGGIFNNGSGTLSVTNSTLSGNSATFFGGGILNVCCSALTAQLTNTILANPTGGDCSGSFTDNGGNLADDGTCFFTQSSSTNGAAPLNLGSLADNGGPTKTIALLPGSVAIDFTSCLQPTDQRGSPRPDGAEIMCDSGAYEFQDDTTPPTCVLKGTVPGGIVIATQDPDGGLAATTGGTFTTAPSPAGGIQLTAVGNASVTIPAVAVGTTGEEDVTALKITAGVSSHVSLAVTDAAGNVTLCDPVLTGVIRNASQPITTTVGGIARGEHLLHIYNGNPGVTALSVGANGVSFGAYALRPGGQRTVDIGAALQAGSNTVTLTAAGKPGGEATIVIADS